MGIKSIDITTNGYFISENIDVLKKYKNINNITVTLNTLNEKVYKIIHNCKKGSLEKVIKGLTLLKNAEFNVSLNIVPLDINKQNIMDILNYA